MVENKYIFFVNDNLPENGWFQNCIHCNNITSKIFLIENNDMTRYYIYLCNTCKKREIYKSQQIKNLVNEYKKTE